MFRWILGLLKRIYEYGKAGDETTWSVVRGERGWMVEYAYVIYAGTGGVDITDRLGPFGSLVEAAAEGRRLFEATDTRGTDA